MGRVTVLDADVLADYLNRRGAWEAVRAHLSGQTAATTTVAAFEVWCGLGTEHARAAFRDVLRAMRRRVYPLESRSAERAGAIFRTLGLSKGQRDCLVAAACLDRRAPLLTRNWRHFERVEGLDVLRAPSR
jgi:tRNA(fMet)-specific endonuclease VapC